MKKFIISVIILLIFAGAGLVIGFIHVPPDYHAVIHTTIWGFDKTVYLPDARLWRWEKLLPTVFTLYKYDLSPYSADLKSPVKGSLYPSGNDYAKALGENFDFTFELNFFIQFRINPDRLVGLVVEGLRPETMTKWYEETAFKLSEQITTIVVKDPEMFLKQTKDEYMNKITGIISDEKDFAGIILITVDPKSVNVPDYDAYSALKERYFRSLEVKTQAQNDIINAEKSRRMEAIKKEIEIIRNIEKYGEILTKYPAIIDFLEKDNPKVRQQGGKESE